MKDKLVIGLMSGTSVDGVDAVLVKINPDFSFEVLSSLVYQYSQDFIEAIKSLFSENVYLQDVCSMNFLISHQFANAVKELLKNAGVSPCEVDFAGSHGQTVYHYPSSKKYFDMPVKSTLQIGDISVLAKLTGIDVIGNFRTADIAAGGEGAPLVCFADEKIFSKGDKRRAIQNLGGMGNVTVISPDYPIFAFDTGPANVLIDYFVQKYFNEPYDKNGRIASEGRVCEKLLHKLLQNPYFDLKPPKTTGRELFGAEFALKIERENSLSPTDLVATLTAFTAKSISQSYKKFVFPKVKIDEIVLGGGGAYNTTLKSMLSAEFDNKIPIKTHEDFGISNKFKEAIAFAMLAYAYYYDIENNVPTCTGAHRKTVMGQMAKAR